MKMKKKLLLLSTFALFSLDRHNAGQGVSCCKAAAVKIGDANGSVLKKGEEESSEINAKIEKELSTHIVTYVNTKSLTAEKIAWDRLPVSLADLENARYIKFEENNDEKTKGFFNYLIHYVNNFKNESTPMYYLVQAPNYFKGGKTCYPVARKVDGVYVYDCCLYVEHDEDLTGGKSLLNILNSKIKTITMLVPEFVYFSKELQDKFYQAINIEGEVNNDEKQHLSIEFFRDKGQLMGKDSIYNNVISKAEEKGIFYQIIHKVGNERIFKEDEELAMVLGNKGIYRLENIDEICKYTQDASKKVIKIALITTLVGCLGQSEKIFSPK